MKETMLAMLLFNSNAATAGEYCIPCQPPQVVVIAPDGERILPVDVACTNAMLDV